MNLDDINKLIELMEKHGLAEIELEDEQGKIRLRKDSGGTEQAADLEAVEAGNSAGGGGGNRGNGGGTEARAAEAPAAAGAVPRGSLITSPLVGTFYRASAPDAAPFVQVGDPVDLDTTVCIIEAMKVMNEIKAETVGSIRKVLVENAAPVEYDQPLFEVAT